MLNFITGPLFVFSLLVFVVGLLVRAVLYVRGLDWRLERVAYGYHPERSIPGALVSIVKWLIPGGTSGWRSQPAAMASFFLLHLGAVLVPLFLLGHTVLLENFTGISLPSLPNALADILSVMSVAGILLLVARRLASPALRQLNSGGDWLVLLLTLLPFCTGLMARLDTSAYQTWIVLHVLSGELFLILAPFTKLSHIVLYFMSRAQLGMDFAIKRGGTAAGHFLVNSGIGINSISFSRKKIHVPVIVQSPPVTSKEGIHACFRTGGAIYYRQMREMPVNQATLARDLEQTCKSRTRTWLAICALRDARESRFFYKTNNNDPTQIPSYKIQSTSGRDAPAQGPGGHRVHDSRYGRGLGQCTCCNWGCGLYCPHGIDTGVMRSAICAASLFKHGFCPGK